MDVTEGEFTSYCFCDDCGGGGLVKCVGQGLLDSNVECAGTVCPACTQKEIKNVCANCKPPPTTPLHNATVGALTTTPEYHTLLQKHMLDAAMANAHPASEATAEAPAKKHLDFNVTGDGGGPQEPLFKLEGIELFVEAAKYLAALVLTINGDTGTGTSKLKVEKMFPGAKRFYLVDPEAMGEEKTKALRELLETKVEERIKKKYRCLIHDSFKPKEGEDGILQPIPHVVIGSKVRLGIPHVDVRAPGVINGVLHLFDQPDTFFFGSLKPELDALFVATTKQEVAAIIKRIKTRLSAAKKQMEGMLANEAASGNIPMAKQGTMVLFDGQHIHCGRRALREKERAVVFFSLVPEEHYNAASNDRLFTSEYPVGFLGPNNVKPLDFIDFGCCPSLTKEAPRKNPKKVHYELKEEVKDNQMTANFRQYRVLERKSDSAQFLAGQIIHYPVKPPSKPASTRFGTRSKQPKVPVERKVERERTWERNLSGLQFLVVQVGVLSVHGKGNKDIRKTPVALVVETTTTAKVFLAFVQVLKSKHVIDTSAKIIATKTVPTDDATINAIKDFLKTSHSAPHHDRIYATWLSKSTRAEPLELEGGGSPYDADQDGGDNDAGDDIEETSDSPPITEGGTKGSKRLNTSTTDKAPKTAKTGKNDDSDSESDGSPPTGQKGRKRKLVKHVESRTTTEPKKKSRKTDKGRGKGKGKGKVISSGQCVNEYSTDLWGSMAVRAVQDFDSTNHSAALYVHLCFEAMHTPCARPRLDRSKPLCVPKSRVTAISFTRARRPGRRYSKAPGDPTGNVYRGMLWRSDVYVGKLLEQVRCRPYRCMFDVLKLTPDGCHRRSCTQRTCTTKRS